jgi:serine/threonine protein kinase
VTRQGIKLLDFGLAKQTASLKDTDLTRALTGQGQILGTLQYMSPEQLQGNEVDARSDLFSFGCVLYELERPLQPLVRLNVDLGAVGFLPPSVHGKCFP